MNSDPQKTGVENMDFDDFMALVAKATPAPLRVRDASDLGRGICVDAPEIVIQGKGIDYSRTILEDDEYPERFADAMRIAAGPAFVDFVQAVRKAQHLDDTAFRKAYDTAMLNFETAVLATVKRTEKVKNHVFSETDDFMAAYNKRFNGPAS